jgi:hypothetical protein
MSTVSERGNPSPRRRKWWIAIGLILALAGMTAPWRLSAEHDPRLVGVWKNFRLNDEPRIEIFPDGRGLTTAKSGIARWTWTTSNGRFRLVGEGRRTTDRIVEYLLPYFPGLRAWHSGIDVESPHYHFSETGSLYLDHDGDPRSPHEFVRMEPTAR